MGSEVKIAENNDQSAKHGKAKKAKNSVSIETSNRKSNMKRRQTTMIKSNGESPDEKEFALLRE